MKNWLYLLFITFVPGIELRGSIPLGILQFKFSPFKVFLVLTGFNILIIPLVFLLWDFALYLAHRIKFIDKYLRNLDVRAKPVIEKYGLWGLVLFVAIPLPGTGAYTGAFIAEIFDMDKKKAFWSITLGVVIAGIIVTLASTGILPFLGVHK